MPLLEVKSQPLHVADRGSGDAVLFLHAFPLQAAMWDYQVEALEGTHRCLTLDLPGFGQSPDPIDPDHASMDRWADMVAGALDELDVDQATVVGSSIGGHLAMAMLRNHRDRVRQIVLADTTAKSDDAATAQRRTDQQEQLRSGAEVSSLSMARPELVEYVHALGAGASSDGWIGALQALKGRSDAMFMLRQADVRALVIVGELDRVTPIAEAMSVRSLLKGELVVVPNVGHLPNIEDPLAFNDALTAFLSG